MKLKNKVCIVTGAARGIGRAVARAYAAEGAIVYAADRIADELEAEVTNIKAKGATAYAFAVDLANPSDVERFSQQVLGHTDQIDVLANVAGIIAEKHLIETTLEEWNAILDINLRGPFLTCRAFAPLMVKAGKGSIINVSSRAGVMGFANEIAYCASKWGLEGMSRAIADDLGPQGIAVNTITPGHPTHTSMSEITYGPEQRKIWKDPIEISPAFVHLALQTPKGIHNQYVNAWQLSEQLRSEGWVAA
jgi:NAD(P)-dependent dehydrogenase (short-subunit alcohol dehydrogenase family)